MRALNVERYILGDGFASMREIVATAVAEAGRGFVPPVMPVPLARALAGGGERLAGLVGSRPLL
ncbi:MAG: hypothetical protein ACR2OC_09230, partial [Solirubrobacterales bacterium]